LGKYVDIYKLSQYLKKTAKEPLGSGAGCAHTFRRANAGLRKM